MPKVATGRKFRNSSSVGAKTDLPTPLESLPGQRSINGKSKVDEREGSLSVSAAKTSPAPGPGKLLPKEASNATLPSSSAVLSRGQKKRQMKRDQYLRKEQMILSSLRLKRQEEQSRRIDGLDALKDALMNIESTTAPTIADDHPAVTVSASAPSKINTNHSRQVLLQKEVAHMNLVLQHPRFVEDPFSTIYEHLQNTFPATTTTKAPPKPVAKKRQRHKSHYRATRSKR